MDLFKFDITARSCDNNIDIVARDMNLFCHYFVNKYFVVFVSPFWSLLRRSYAKISV